MGDWVDIEEAIRSPGLRVVLTPGVPGPYSEAAKGILHVKKLPYLKARQEILGANLALHRWTGQTGAPVVAWNDEPPRVTWIEQLALFERLAPEPRLIPADWDERTTMFGLAQEILGEGAVECGEKDTHVPPDGAVRFQQALRKHNPEAAARVRVNLIPGLKHLDYQDPIFLSNCIAWFASG